MPDSEMPDCDSRSDECLWPKFEWYEQLGQHRQTSSGLFNWLNWQQPSAVSQHCGKFFEGCLVCVSFKTHSLDYIIVHSGLGGHDVTLVWESQPALCVCNSNLSSGTKLWNGMREFLIWYHWVIIEHIYLIYRLSTLTSLSVGSLF